MQPMGSHAAHVFLIPIPETKISATTLNPISRLNYHFVCSFRCIVLCREVDLEQLWAGFGVGAARAALCVVAGRVDLKMPLVASPL